MGKEWAHSTWGSQKGFKTQKGFESEFERLPQVDVGRRQVMSRTALDTDLRTLVLTFLFDLEHILSEGPALHDV